VSDRWKRRLWIVDGHNAIFTLPDLCRLQTEGARQAARRALERLLEPFAGQLARPLLIVYDGNELPANPDASRSSALHTLYSQPPEEADDRIVFLATEARRRDQSVSIVTNDRRSLQVRLPQDVPVIPVEEFCRRFLLDSAAPETDEKQVSERARQEIAGMFLDRAPEIQEGARRGARQRERRALARWRSRRGDPDNPAGGGADARGREAPGAEPGWRPPPVGPTRLPRERGPGMQRSTKQDEAPAQDALEQSAREARQARKRRGARKQQRRLAARRRGAKGSKKKRRQK
jgi:predicted RNA-binding protein with PIN domain